MISANVIVGIDTTIDEEHDDEDVQWDIFGRRAAVNDYEREIQPQQTWMDKFFGVKPQIAYMCMNLTRKRTRQELSAMLKDWRRYGVMEVKTNKTRQMIFASIGKINCKYTVTSIQGGALTVLDLNLKPVSIVIEIMAVKEHGMRGYLAICRITKEKGSNKAFKQCVATIEHTCRVRGYLVRDERKAKMMIKTLQMSDA